MELYGGVRCLYIFVRSLWKQPCPDPRPETPNRAIPFLQLPVELVWLVAEFLTPAEIALFSLTCRPIRAVLGEGSSAAHLSRDDYLAYLVGLARDLPKQWVCGVCTALHPTLKFDTPSAFNLRRASCPKHHAGYNRPNMCLGRFQICLEHHHVQLALKYTRLQQREYNSYLQALLKPYHTRYYKSSSRTISPHKTFYSAYPRVVTDNHGNLRFLLLSTWQYLRGSRDISLNNLGGRIICPHLDFNFWTYHHYHTNALATAVHQVFKAEDTNSSEERAGGCPRCATDFSVRLSRGDLLLYVWQDFGPESSPFDLAWQSQIMGGSLVPGVFNNSPWSGLTLYHEPGSVKKLYYESEPESRPDLASKRVV
ncbi:hypothetical protein F4861DRAFT_49086 [Xylaria intraflava]|nr:hypothetical protein F4861DRAFT_49086 [Xylaria intraflava]